MKWRDRASRDLAALPVDVQKRIDEATFALESEKPPARKTLQGGSVEAFGFALGSTG